MVKEQKPVVEADVSCCPKCGSTERERYTDKREHAYAGVHDGKPFTHVVWRTTRCARCAQVRADKVFENRCEPTGVALHNMLVEGY